MPETGLWVIIAAIAAAISASCAAVSIIFTFLMKKEELKFGRPYFMIKKGSGLERISTNSLRIKIIMDNIGKRPASNYKCKIIIFECGLTSPPILNIELSSGNDLPPDSPSRWDSPPFAVAANVLLTM